MKLPLPEPNYGSPSADLTNRHARDAYLRKAGFKIHSRKRGQQPTWERNGDIFIESQALRIASSECECADHR